MSHDGSGPSRAPWLAVAFALLVTHPASAQFVTMDRQASAGTRFGADFGGVIEPNFDNAAFLTLDVFCPSDSESPVDHLGVLFAGMIYERTLADVEAVGRTLERELAHGGAFVPAARPPSPLSRVDVRIVLPDGHSEVIAGLAVNVMAAGFFVQFDRGPAFDALLVAARLAMAPPAIEDRTAEDEPDDPAADESDLLEPEGDVQESAQDEVPAEPESEEERQRMTSAWDLIDTTSSVPLYRQIAALAVPDRIRLARYATRPVRQVLVRDVEKRIHLEVVKNPKSSDSELEEWSGMPGLSPEALRWIATQKRLVARLNVQMNLIQNPGTPSDIALRLLSVLPVAELPRIMRSTKVREPLRRAARKRLMESGNL